MLKINSISDYKVAQMIFNMLLVDEEIETIVRRMGTVTYSSCTSTMLANFVRLQGDNFQPVVYLYKTWKPGSKALAKTYRGNYSKMYLNSRKLNRSLGSLTGTIAHEWGHLLESFVRERLPTAFFNHGSNSRVGKEQSFQYTLGRKVKELVEEREDVFLRRLGLKA